MFARSPAVSDEAEYKGQPEAVQRLLEAGAEVNAIDGVSSCRTAAYLTDVDADGLHRAVLR